MPQPLLYAKRQGAVVPRLGVDEEIFRMQTVRLYFQAASVAVLALIVAFLTHLIAEARQTVTLPVLGSVLHLMGKTGSFATPALLLIAGALFLYKSYLHCKWQSGKGTWCRHCQGMLEVGLTQSKCLHCGRIHRDY